MSTLKFHPAADLLPLLTGPEFDAMVEDIRANGLKVPIVLDPVGDVLDGRNRLRACEKAGVAPAFETWNPARDGGMQEAVEYVLSANLHRRHLQEGQKAAVVVEAQALIDRFVAEGRAAMEAGIGPDGSGGRGKKKNPGEKVREGLRERRTDEKLAKAGGTNATYVRRAAKLKVENPSAFEAVKRGEKNLSQVKREADRARKDERAAANRSRVATVDPAASLEALAASGTKFSTITLDPPWNYAETPEGSGDLGEPDYETQSLEWISRLPVAGLADEDCHVFCWTTFRFLEATFALFKGGTVKQKGGELRIAGWGIRPIAILTWWKQWVREDGTKCHPLGLGSHFRWDAEYVLVGTIGKPEMLSKKQGVVFEGPPKEHRHSSKPLAFYDLVEGCSSGPYMEFFARGGRKDWTSWGQDGVVKS